MDSETNSKNYTNKYLSYNQNCLVFMLTCKTRKMVNNEIFDAFKQHILKCSRGTSFVYYLCCVITLLKTINHAISRKNCRTKRDCVCMNVDTRSKDYTDKISLNTFNLRKYNISNDIKFHFVSYIIKTY